MGWLASYLFFNVTFWHSLIAAQTILSVQDFLTENQHKSFSNKLFINTAKYLGFRIFRFKPVTKVVEGMSKQTGHHPGQGCSSQGECVAVNRLRTIPTIHQSEYLRQPPPNIPKQSSSAVFSRLGIPPKIHTSVLSFFAWPFENICFWSFSP